MKKNLLIFTFLFFLILGANAQKFKGLDKSPMDMAYYPDEFAHDRKFAPQKVGDKAYIRLIYSRPAKNERVIFGKLVPYGKVWRTGANEATEITFAKDGSFGGKAVKAGTYSLFTIPTEKEWTVILNSELKQWGSYDYSKIKAKDVAAVKVPVAASSAVTEKLTITASDVAVNFAWDNVSVSVPVKF